MHRHTSLSIGSTLRQRAGPARYARHKRPGADTEYATPWSVSPNVEPAVADLTEPDNLPAAMAGVTHHYLVTEAAPTTQHVQMQRNALFADFADFAAGVRHVVAQSVQFAAHTAPVEVMRSHASSEELLRLLG
jgi:uncharacterized protein YbjT (DUF2867 family)